MNSLTHQKGPVFKPGLFRPVPTVPGIIGSLKEHRMVNFIVRSTFNKASLNQPIEAIVKNSWIEDTPIVLIKAEAAL
ncbi:MAG: hypothetical protein KBG64_00395 [Clostridia bacterium]|nr:hypothetical protein [Clostridia bacterium]